MSDEQPAVPRASHPLRLTLRMIVGTFSGFGIGAATHAVGNGFDPWFRSAPFAYAIAGAAIGLCVELWTRRDERIKREILLAALTFGLLALFAALVL